jgi:hypothetical protein
MELHFTVDTQIIMIGTGMSDPDRQPCLPSHDSFLSSLQNEDDMSVCLALDDEGHVQHQYEQKMGEESEGRRWLQRLASKNKIRFYNLGKFPKGFLTKLKEASFHKGDHKLVRLSMATSSRLLVSEDQDFSKGVCKTLRKQRGVEVIVLTAEGANTVIKEQSSKL